MFAKSQKIDLITTKTDDYIVLWKECYDRCFSFYQSLSRHKIVSIFFSFVLIGISTGCTLKVFERLLQSVFNALVLIVGLQEIKTQKNVERLKREIRVVHFVFIYYNLIFIIILGILSFSRQITGFVKLWRCQQ